MMKVVVDYADKDLELEMYKKHNVWFDDIKIDKILSKKDIKDIWKLLDEIYVSDNIYKYVADIIDSTRNPENYWNLSQIKKYLSYWISPRWGLSLISAAKSLALLNNRTFVIPEDIKKLASRVLSHRLVLNYEAVTDWITNEKMIDVILKNIKIS
jgi:MoxR-like ATPase